jgi:hypothetical protein
VVGGLRDALPTPGGEPPLRDLPDRPIICRDFDNTTCDVNDPEGGLAFATPEEFLSWLKGKRPRLYRRLAERYVPAALRAAEAVS